MNDIDEQDHQESLDYFGCEWVQSLAPDADDFKGVENASL